MVKSSAVNTDIPFSLDSPKARRIFTLNTHEEKRLEKVRWNLEKQRMAETKKFLKAKKDIIIHHFRIRKVHSSGQVGIHDRLLTMNSGWKTSHKSCYLFVQAIWTCSGLFQRKTTLKTKKHAFLSTLAPIAVKPQPFPLAVFLTCEEFW